MKSKITRAKKKKRNEKCYSSFLLPFPLVLSSCCNLFFGQFQVASRDCRQSNLRCEKEEKGPGEADKKKETKKKKCWRGKKETESK